MSGFAVIVPDLVKDLNIPISSSTWPAAAYSLMVSSVMLPLGRLADIYGGRPVYIAGLAWLTVWSLIAGFSKDQYMLDICRALQGLGPAAFMPSGMLLLGRTYRPGPRKNFVFSEWALTKDCCISNHFRYIWRMWSRWIFHWYIFRWIDCTVY